MDEYQIKNLSLALSLLGLIIIYALTFFVDYQEFNLTSGNNDNVRITGELVDYSKSDKVTRLKIRHYLVSEAVSFDEIPELSGNITVVGRVGSYNGKKQVIIEEIHRKD